jgi:predicted RND superfamily exporter protein
MQSLSAHLRRLMHSLGKSVATHPKTYIVLSTLISLILSTGLFQAREDQDFDMLYFDSTSESATAWKFMNKHFPVNYSAFQPDRYVAIMQRIHKVLTRLCALAYRDQD